MTVKGHEAASPGMRVCGNPGVAHRRPEPLLCVNFSRKSGKYMLTYIGDSVAMSAAYFEVHSKVRGIDGYINRQTDR